MERLLAIVPSQGHEAKEELEKLCAFYANKFNAKSIRFPDGKVAVRKEH